ncbi:MAG: sigma factor-like helix-turn-helix DNA-binding protein [Acidimicrobiia bacterium]
MASLILDDPDRTETALSAAVRSVWESPALVPEGDGERAALAGIVYRCCQKVAAAAAATCDSLPPQPTGSLTSDERSAFALAALGGHSYRDVARVVGTDPPAVVSQLRSVLRRLAP